MNLWANGKINELLLASEFVKKKQKFPRIGWRKQLYLWAGCVQVGVGSSFSLYIVCFVLVINRTILIDNFLGLHTQYICKWTCCKPHMMIFGMVIHLGTEININFACKSTSMSNTWTWKIRIWTVQVLRSHRLRIHPLLWAIKPRPRNGHHHTQKSVDNSLSLV